MTDRPATLRTLMLRHSLTRPAVAELCGVSLSTVGSWLAPPGAVRRREMPERALRLLRLALLTAGE